MRKFIFSAVMIFFSLVLVTPAFANEKADQELEKLSQTGEIIYEDDEITVISFGDDPEISDAIFNHPNSVVVNESEISSENGSSPKDVLASTIEVWQPFLAELAMQIFGYFCIHTLGV
ncbi:hypothetical protein QT236_17935 (plasmid) [Geobacillus stearothermophilus]|nr:hypothetical protein QT236_17935 [Geobacillus stearothermophilus]